MYRGLAFILGLLTAASFVMGGPLTLHFRGTVAFPTATSLDQSGNTFAIAGLSGLAYVGPALLAGGDEGEHDYLAVMDNSNRLVRFRVRYLPDGSLATVQTLAGLTLSALSDFEGVALASAELAILAEESTPGLREIDLATGAQAGALPLPTIFAQRRPNFGLESATSRRPPTGNLTVWTGNEEALQIDGPSSTPSVGTMVRLQRFEGGPGLWTAGPQWAYLVDPMHGGVVNGARSGLVELVVLPDGGLLALERSFAFNLGGFFRTRIYQIDGSSATDVQALASLGSGGFSSVAKQLLWQGNLNNLEGLALGPILPSGERSMLGVVDDGDPISTNQVIAFVLAGAVEPSKADLDWNRCVDLTDLLQFLDSWLTNLGGVVAVGAVADATGDGSVDLADLLEFLSDWLIDVGLCDG